MYRARSLQQQPLVLAVFICVCVFFFSARVNYDDDCANGLNDEQMLFASWYRQYMRCQFPCFPTRASLYCSRSSSQFLTPKPTKHVVAGGTNNADALFPGKQTRKKEGMAKHKRRVGERSTLKNFVLSNEVDAV